MANTLAPSTYQQHIIKELFTYPSFCHAARSLEELYGLPAADGKEKSFFLTATLFLGVVPRKKMNWGYKFAQKIFTHHRTGGIIARIRK